MRKVYTHENVAILYTAKNLLELNGIDSFLKNEFYASGGHSGLLGIPPELWVRDDQKADQAIAILKDELDDTNSNPAWVCNKCQEENEAAFEVCWQCQNPQKI